MARLPSRPWPVLSGSRAARLWTDGAAVLVLLVVPVWRYAWPAFTGGALVMPGDDYDQNFPLRVLVGQQIRDGIIPLLDPFNWSGSPLLGGWNSGAAYPATWLFAIMPANPAWVLGELLTYGVGGIGLYAFLRAQTVEGRPLRPLPALLGAASFSIGGSFAIQVEHFGLAAGVSWIPLALLAIWKLSTSDRPLRWVLVLGASGGMCVLAGEPRAVAIAAVVLAVYVVWRVVRQPAGRWRLVLLLASGGLLALLLSAVQWAPGMAVVADSQREGGGYRLFGAGSMTFGQLPLIVQPMLLGGSGNGGYPAFLGDYSLTEIASYVGLLPLVAAGAFVRRWRRPLPEWVCWLGLAVLGVLLALGSSTPLGHVWHLIPFYGGQRLQSRNILITGLALSVLLAYWAQEWIDRPQLRRRFGMLVPLAGAIGLGVAAIVAGPQLVRGLGVPAETASAARDLRPVVIVFLAFAVACVVLLVVASRLPRPVRAGAVAVLVAFDLGAFTLTVIQEDTGEDAPSGSSTATVQTSGTSVRPAPLRVPAGQIGRDGRFLIYGPDGIGSRSVGGVGDPDLNVIAKRYSVQGYTAAVDARYAGTTGTHGILAGGQHTASLWALESGVLDQLSAKYLITQPNRLLSIAATDKSAERHVERTVDAGATQMWSFGEVLRLARVSVPVSSDTHRVRLGLRSAGGGIRWLRTQNAGGFLTADIRPAADATALVLRPADQTVTVSAPALSLSDGRDFIADGDLQSVLQNGGWRFQGNMDGYAVFTNPAAEPVLRAGPGATVRRTGGDPLLPESVRVSSPHGTEVVRSVASIRGWSATWTPEHGSSRTLPVRTHGLVQAVQVPAGMGTLQWRYRTPDFVLGMVLSLIGVVLAAGAGGWALVRRR